MNLAPVPAHPLPAAAADPPAATAAAVVAAPGAAVPAAMMTECGLAVGSCSDRPAHSIFVRGVGRSFITLNHLYDQRKS